MSWTGGGKGYIKGDPPEVKTGLKMRYSALFSGKRLPERRSETIIRPGDL